MTDVPGALLGGLLLGLAGSFHCACMCGGIASGALFMLRPPSARERVAMLLVLNGGRIAVYALAGGAFAGAAGLAIGPAATATTYKLLQWLGAAVLMWVGLALAGAVPRLALPQRLGALSAAAQRVRLPTGHATGMAPPLAMGLTWGLTPCPMAYAALFSATMTGSLMGGVAWMTGFGLGTLPGVMGASLGIAQLSRLRASRGAEIVAGVAVAAFGLFSATASWPQLLAFCLPQ